MMKQLFLIAFLLTCYSTGFAQKSDVDSLQKAYNKNKQDTTLVQLLDAKAIEVYLQTNTDSGLLCTKQGLEISRRIHYKYGEMRSLANMANYLNIMGDLPGALRVTFEALPIAIELKDNGSIGECYNTLGLTYSTLKDLKKAGAYYHKTLEFAILASDHAQHIIALNNISRNYLDRDMLDSALWYTNQAYAVARKNNMLTNEGFLIRNLGMIEFKKGNYAKAIDYYNKSAALKTSKNNHYLQSEDFRRTAEAYQKLNMLDSCINFAKRAYEQCKLDRNPETIMRTTGLLTDVFKSKNDYKQAYYYQEIMLAARDSLFSQQKTMQVQNLMFSEQQRQDELKAAQVAYQNKVRYYTMLGILGVVVLIVLLLWYSNSARKRANKLLHEQKEEIASQRDNLEQAYSDLKITQTQLVQREKMASLGELTAGIAHEIQNPLNFVNNFSEVNTELIAEIKQEIEKGDLEEIEALAVTIEENSKKISMHGRRADAIVKGMLQHSQSGSGTKEPVNINALTNECMRLSYHGLRAKDKSFNAELTLNLDDTLPKIKAIQQDLVRVMLNLFNNAFYAVNQKQKTDGTDYKPEVSVTTFTENGNVIIKVKDNGTGIPDAIKDKIMQPFFTTKPTGEGTGLGLSLTYDMIVKGHGGSIQVNSKEGAGSEFIIILPVV
jgi:signal transduction histidine kinase